MHDGGDEHVMVVVLVMSVCDSGGYKCMVMVMRA